MLPPGLTKITKLAYVQSNLVNLNLIRLLDQYNIKYNKYKYCIGYLMVRQSMHITLY
jgi:hypothetical protein